MFHHPWLYYVKARVGAPKVGFPKEAVTLGAKGPFTHIVYI